MTTRHLALFFALLMVPRIAYSGGIFEVLGKVLQADQYLFILGDRGAEKRLGYLLSRFYLLTSPVNRDPEINRWVNGIFEKLKKATPRSRYEYRIHVINSPQINAFALPGGTIFIYRGMLDFAQSDDEVACVLGHEIAHAFRRHGLQRIRRDAAAQALIQKLFKNSNDMQILGQVAHLFTSTSFSRKNEDESDAIGMQIAHDAGFDPSGATSLWQRMQARFGSRGATPSFLSSHPSHKARIANTQKWLHERGLGYNRPRVKSYDSKTDSLVNLLPQGDFEAKGSGGLPQGWKLLEGSLKGLEHPSGPPVSGSFALTGTIHTFGESLRLASDPLPIRLFQEPRILRGQFVHVDGSPRIYLGLDFQDREGKSLETRWEAANALEIRSKTPQVVSSKALDPKSFPAGTEQVSVLLTLGRLIPGSVRADALELVRPGTAVSKDAALLANGNLELDKNQDGLPDGFSARNVEKETTEPAEGFVAARMRAKDQDALFTTPRISVQTGKTYRFQSLFRAEAAGRPLEIHWLGYDAQGKLHPKNPPPKRLEASLGWQIAKDELTISPPPGTPAVTRVEIQLRAPQDARGDLWVDDLRFTRLAKSPEQSSP